MKKKAKFFIIFSPIFVFLLIWGIAIGKCEILTFMHGSEFSELSQVDDIIGEQKCLKILEYSENYAKVYYVEKNNSMANILCFSRHGEQWEYNNWERCVWSTSGSADDVVWPYWWHAIYFLF